MKKLTFHILGVPHTVSSTDYNACAYTQKVVKFGKMMTQRGHTVIHYGHEDSNLICTEHVTVVTNEDFNKCYGSHDWKTQFFKYDVQDHTYQTFYKNAIREIESRKGPNEFILPFWGAGVRPICDAHPDLICVEPGIGYPGGHWADWKIFESYAIYHAYCGLGNVAACKQNWYDVVIPNYFDLEEFEFRERKDDYFLYLGRVYSGKGVDIAIETCNHIGAKLIIAGQGNLDEFPNLPVGDNIEHVGYADVAKRKELMAGAKGLFLPSKYVEPFGGVQIEALLSGTPTITTDWGAFAENNIHGLTGYRCRTFGDFVNAAKHIELINPKNCREFAENFSLDRVAPMYEKFFMDVLNCHTAKGWYAETDPTAFLAPRTIPHHPTRCNFTSIRNEEEPQAKHIAEWARMMGIKSMLDVGCGPGIYVDALNHCGVSTLGLDIDIREDHPNIAHHDITTGPYVSDDDAILCLEVAEHIPEEHADKVVANLCKSGAHTIIWSAAAPGQGGDGHVNCQPKEYWEMKFRGQGAFRSATREASLLSYVKRGTHMGWLRNNLMIFHLFTEWS